MTQPAPPEGWSRVDTSSAYRASSAARASRIPRRAIPGVRKRATMTAPTQDATDGTTPGTGCAPDQPVELYDTTLRDGLGMEGLSLSLEDKLLILQKLDELGVHYIEGGYPGSNPKDAEFFERARQIELKHARLVAFGSTRRAGGDAKSDPAIQAVLKAGTPVVTLVGKSSSEQVREVLQTTEEENLAMIR